MTTEQAAAVATLRDQLSNGCAMDCWQEISHLLAALDAAQATVAKWETALSAVMPADFADWHQNSRTEWPELAAWVITNLRKREAEAWQDIPPPDDPPIPDPREETKRALIAWAVAYGNKVAAAQATQPAALLVRDIANDLGVAPLQACRALETLGYGRHSVNMAVTGDMARELGRFFAAAQAPRDVPRLTEPDMVACLVASSCVGTVKMSYDSGPYEITRTSINADRLCRAVEARVRELCGVAP